MGKVLGDSRENPHGNHHEITMDFPCFLNGPWISPVNFDVEKKVADIN
jgi:hypothetical protein